MLLMLSVNGFFNEVWVTRCSNGDVGQTQGRWQIWWQKNRSDLVRICSITLKDNLSSCVKMNHFICLQEKTLSAAIGMMLVSTNASQRFWMTSVFCHLTVHWLHKWAENPKWLKFQDKICKKVMAKQFKKEYNE